LNADVTAVGFPYGGLLGGLNVTRGSVSALKGLSGDLTTMQITAPIQTGNSGGPVLASDGEVIGVVVSKLDAQRTNELIGDTPQNVNFAVRGEIARLFMSQNGVEPTLSLDNIKLEPEALAKLAAKFTVFVECR
jgi:serine protease Do